ncbi:hypothetical protein BaRGS_00008020 [Batillaria attramentaria]|uniref:Uncharacterized protein n=1 Tax=Batillaria attramentaria TaxID=370345 RepID=A0ABD0LNB8_9CAEN
MLCHVTQVLDIKGEELPLREDEEDVLPEYVRGYGDLTQTVRNRIDFVIIRNTVGFSAQLKRKHEAFVSAQSTTSSSNSS